jgi:hypothetical protein
MAHKLSAFVHYSSGQPQLMDDSVDAQISGQIDHHEMIFVMAK